MVRGVVIQQIDEEEYLFGTDAGRELKVEADDDALPIGERIELRGEADDEEFELKSWHRPG